ncbi:metal ABC transporter solute-binding protein, Zn/Mn family [Arthrobacter halodurans]|uniref:Metal ABC transporter solute-binding protein, Zn/Mn family n=1 Tax=Arthrobacter halodurans TaxID=516699 RepID=A0ABV4ULW6_9MICC
MQLRRLLPVALASSLALAGCAPGEPAAETGDGRLAVVASTSVYADVVRSVGGDQVDVSAIIDKTSQDPHSYEATAQDKLLLSKADLVVSNGGGYDGFMDVLAQDLDLPAASLVTAVDFAEEAHAGEAEDAHAGEAEASDDGHGHGDTNEHVWYDLHTVEALAAEVSERLTALRPESAELFTANAEEFAASLAPVEERIATLSASADGRTFAMTEPVPYYLLLEAGLRDGTPEGFSEAIEEGGDVSPLLLRQIQDGLADGEYAVLAYNAQTAGPQTESVRQAAERAGVPVVEFTETLPEGEDFVSWMTSNTAALEAALAS